jgi:hypothetical protein
MWFSIFLALAGFAAFILAGASVRSLSNGSTRAASLCARCSVVLGALSLVLAALWLAAEVFWPLAAAGFSGGSLPEHFLRGPLRAIAASSGLAAVALPTALLVIRALERRTERARWSAALEHGDVR